MPNGTETKEIVVDTIDGIPITVDTKIGAFHATVNGRTFENRALNTVRKEVGAWLRETADKREVLEFNLVNPDSPARTELSLPRHKVVIARDPYRGGVQFGDGLSGSLESRYTKLVPADSAVEQQAATWTDRHAALRLEHLEAERALLREYRAWVDSLPTFDPEGLRDHPYPTTRW